MMDMKEIPVNIALISDDELEEDESYSASELLRASEQDEISNSLVESGTMSGLAAAAALVTSRKRHRPYKFEINPAQRKRQHTRLIRKLKQTIHELCTRCGQQAVVLNISPNKDNPTFRVFGSSPLDQVVRRCQGMIFRDLEKELQDKLPQAHESSELFELPPLMVDGIPTTVDQMNQAQLRMFVPEMLKYSTGRGKPGWGKESMKPIWWPQDVPWANVRRDARSHQAKINVSWTQALRQIVKNCYRYHGRDDILLAGISETVAKQSNNKPREKLIRPAPVVTPPTLVQTVHNADGSVSLIQIDSGQTIATISRDHSGTPVATLSNHEPQESQIDISLGEMANGNWTLTDQSNPIHDTYNMIAGVDRDSSNQKQQNDVALEFGTAEQIINSAALTEPVDVNMRTEDGSTMLHIPVSVYEKLAHTIEQSGGNPTVSISEDGRIQFQSSVVAEQDKSPPKKILKTIEIRNKVNDPINSNECTI